MKKLEDFQQKINYTFSSLELLNQALTHPSLTNKNRTIKNNQRLEFLGDKVLSLIIAEFLMKNFQNENEGDLSKRQAHLVSGEMLAEIASEINLAEVLKLSAGEENSGGKTNKRNLEDGLEALIGAIYLDSSFEKTREIILKFFEKYLLSDLEPPKDPVSKLQEFVQLKFKILPIYTIEKTSGAEHSPIFTASLEISELNLNFSATGNSKKEAQKNVAIEALNNLNL